MLAYVPITNVANANHTILTPWRGIGLGYEGLLAPPPSSSFSNEVKDTRSLALAFSRIAAPVVQRYSFSTNFYNFSINSLSRAWGCIVHFESSGKNVVSGDGQHFGYFQFSLPSWHLVGGAGLPTQASLLTQYEGAVALQEIQGWGAWQTASLCGLSGGGGQYSPSNLPQIATVAQSLRW